MLVVMVLGLIFGDTSIENLYSNAMTEHLKEYAMTLFSFNLSMPLVQKDNGTKHS